MLATLAGIALPIYNDLAESSRLTANARDVERELQTARLRAVSANQPMRLRFDCPAARQYRIVELVGTPSVPASADSAANRCGLVSFPYPAADSNVLTRPNHDGPLRELDPSVSFSGATTIEFWPDGTAHTNSAGTDPWPVIAGSGTTVTLVRDGITKTILVNGVGKIQLQ